MFRKMETYPQPKTFCVQFKVDEKFDALNQLKKNVVVLSHQYESRIPLFLE